MQLPARFKLTVPTRKVVLLPDTHFFCRTVPVPAMASPAEVAGQVEIALEGMAPFPVAQMYHGHYWRSGARNALVYAAYRKRFPSEQVETWADAEAVMPAFASMLHAKVAGSTTLLIWAEKTLTAIRWEDPFDAPISVHARELPPDFKPEDRDALRDDLLRISGASIHVAETEAAPTLDSAASQDDEYLFRSTSYDSNFTREEMDVLDVRDKEELQSRRRARSRDLILWRVLLGCAATIALCLLLEGTVFGLGIWQKNRENLVREQTPQVEKIKQTNSLVLQVEERSTKRIRPFEMLTLLDGKLPASVVFSRATVKDLYTLEIEASATNPSDTDLFRVTLSSLPFCESVDVKLQPAQAGRNPFRATVKFRPNAFQGFTQS
ncbi:MAG: hypothetical protein QM715_12350 [Nibricoccus sp.]